jgi:Cu+-exporting ATPase
MAAIDPVCGMTVEPSSAAATRTRDGKTYYFCAEGCAATFDSDPEQFVGETAADNESSVDPFGAS